MRMTISGGTIYDPARSIDGIVGAIHIEGRRIVQVLSAPADRTIDARGLVVFPGGIDLHCHIAGPAVQRARRILSGAHAGSPALAPPPLGTTPADLVVPSAPDTAREYSRLGYTTFIDAAIAPSAAHPAHVELAEAHGLDRGFLLLLGNHELLLDLLERGEIELARSVVARLLERSGALGIKSVNAGGVAHWRRFGRICDGVHDPVAGRRSSPADILRFLAETAETLKLPHPVHIHASRLGRPGNIETTLATSKVLAGIRRHFAHVAFHVYGCDERGRITDASSAFLEHLAADPTISADVGQVLFGKTLTISADQEIGHALWELTGNPFATLDLELEAGAGVCPIEYSDSSRANVLQFAIGLKLFLSSPDPWRLVFSTDHPNGASFVSYPTLVALLMDRGRREDLLARLDPGAAESSGLRGLDREYDLYEIAIITRAGPARILGLPHKGQLGPGADADVTIYENSTDREAMFRRPLWVISRGEIVVSRGQVTDSGAGATLRVAPESDAAGADRLLRAWARDQVSHDAEQCGIGSVERAGSEVVSVSGVS
jgi:formylmethanofuran dehydrogenase subunit A